MDQVSVYDHFQLFDSEYPAGIYRVVGITEKTVTLLKVGDEDGRRVHTGEIIHLEIAKVEGFDRVQNPDQNLRTSVAVKSVLESGYWSIRVFVRELVTQPVPTMFAVALVSFGYFDGQVLPAFSGTVSAVLVVLGSLGLAYIGSGRL